MSGASRRRLTFLLRNTPVALPFMATVTYGARFPTTGQETKAHLNRLLMWLRRRGVGGVWVLEFQTRRGAPHYHVFLSGYVDPAALRAQWSRIIAGYLDEGQQARANIQPIAARLMVPYATKRAQKTVPDAFVNAGRFWGSFNLPKPEPVAQVVGTAPEVAPVIRAVKRAVFGRCRRRPRRLDRGRNSFVLFGGSPVLLAYQQRQTVPSPCDAAPLSTDASFSTLKQRNGPRLTEPPQSIAEQRRSGGNAPLSNETDAAHSGMENRTCGGSVVPRRTRQHRPRRAKFYRRAQVYLFVPVCRLPGTSRAGGIPKVALTSGAAACERAPPDGIVRGVRGGCTGRLCVIARLPLPLHFFNEARDEGDQTNAVHLAQVVQLNKVGATLAGFIFGYSGGGRMQACRCLRLRQSGFLPARAQQTFQCLMFWCSYCLSHTADPAP
jgi:hypothetical protein